VIVVDASATLGQLCLERSLEWKVARDAWQSDGGSSSCTPLPRLRSRLSCSSLLKNEVKRTIPNCEELNHSQRCIRRASKKLLATANFPSLAERRCLDINSLWIVLVCDTGSNSDNVVVNECHHLSAFTFERVMRQVRAMFVIGATPSSNGGPLLLESAGARVGFVSPFGILESDRG
jgi:hypothetical protein